ncbi:hypothetical protein [Lentzea sp. NPDC051838]|uniref:hypothetical protein n=1 Tax=Lentzea sp. NPDC051838 TaxID=3154849 RepID=UPI00342BD63E
MRPIAVLLMSVLLLATCSGGRTGARDPRTAVDTYLAAMNDNDEVALKSVVSEFQRDLVRSHLNERGGRALAVESVVITQDFGPKFAFVHVLGTYADSFRYDERIVVSLRDGRWYLGIPGPIPARPGDRPTSAVTPPVRSGER